MKILHISPTYFSEKSILGGGERYVAQLAKAMAGLGASVTLLSFGDENEAYEQDGVQYKIIRPLFYYGSSKINPFHFSILDEIKKHDIVHCHQYFNIITELSIIYANLFQKKIYITDHGGGGKVILHRLGLTNFVNKFLFVSKYAARHFNLAKDHYDIIYGGCETQLFRPIENIKDQKHYLTVGRVLPHKGHHHIINCLKQDEKLSIIGKKSDVAYYNHLKEIARNKNVIFKENLTEDELIFEINRTSLAIFPSTDIDHHQNKINGHPELFGIAPVETMSTATPTIVSNIGSYPEIAFSRDYIFQHGQVESLRDKIDETINNAPQGSLFREHITGHFTWVETAKRCFKAYQITGLKTSLDKFDE